MFSYSKIIRDSYTLTIQNKILWLFGLFVIGGFNVNFFQYQQIPLQQYRSRFPASTVASFLVAHPGLLATTSASVLVVSLVGLFVTNWSRVMLVLSSNALVQKKYTSIEEEIKKSRVFVFPMIRLSLITTSLIIAAAGVLVAPLLLLGFNPDMFQALGLVGVVVFLPVAFVISCINIFAGFYMVLFKKSFSASVGLATDFFGVNWVTILGLAMLLGVLYIIAFFVGIALIYGTKQIFELIILLGSQLGNFNFSAMIRLVPFFSNFILWLLLAGLNVFFNNALLLLFLQLITPVKFEERIAMPQPAAAGIK